MFFRVDEEMDGRRGGYIVNMALYWLEFLSLVPIAGGSVFSVLCLLCTVKFRLRSRAPEPRQWPAVTILKPVYGLEKNLAENLRTTLLQDYPNYEVLFSVQRLEDPALPLLRELEREFGTDRVKVVVDNRRPGANGKINNLAGAIPHARHDVFVISDSDIRLTTGYLKAIIAPLLEPGVGFVCTPYKVAEAGRWFEKLELLSLNAEFIPSVIFAYETGASGFCLGASIALRREDLDAIGGIEAMANHLVEDYELGRRIAALGKKCVFIPFVIDTMVDLKDAAAYWGHQVYWDQNTRSARPAGFFATFLIRAIPFAILYAALRGFDAAGLSVLAGCVGLRLATAAGVLHVALQDREGLRALPLLPLRDVLGFASWVLAFTRRTTTWRGSEFELTRDGRLVARAAE